MRMWTGEGFSSVGALLLQCGKWKWIRKKERTIRIKITCTLLDFMAACDLQRQRKYSITLGRQEVVHQAPASPSAGSGFSIAPTLPVTTVAQGLFVMDINITGTKVFCNKTTVDQ